MPKAIVDPSELRRFAQNLKKFSLGLEEQMRVLQGQLGALGDTWRDQEHDRFVEEFEQTKQVLRRFVESASNQVPLLLRKAEKIEEYLQQR